MRPLRTTLVLGPLLIVVMVASVLLVSPSPAYALALAVNSTADEPDATPGNGVCAAAPSGACTLRAAVMEANALPGADTITLPANTFQLSRLECGPSCPGSSEDSGAYGDLDILESVTIIGAGIGSTILQPASGTNAWAIDRLFDLVNPSATVTITGLTVKFGRAVDGGGIRNRGTLTLDHVEVASNISVRNGGGIYNEGALILNDVLVANNAMLIPGNLGIGGGGIYSTGTLTATRVLLQSSIGETEDGDGRGGALLNAGTASLIDAVIEGGRANFGGAIANDPSGILALERVLIARNTATRRLGAGPAVGGGILNRGALSAVNTTISGNLIDSRLPDGRGGGIFNDGGSATLTNVTIGENVASTGGHSLANASGSVQIRNTLLFRDGGGNCTGAIVSLGHNVENGDTCAFAAPGDQSNIIPRVGPLAHNGGRSRTHALRAGSPALDKADSGACPATDQRGLPRPRDGNGDGAGICDVGAYEAQSPLPIQASGPFTVTSPADEPDADPGDGVCASTPSSACTLRGAIMEANAVPGADTIIVPANRYELSRIECAPPCNGSNDDTGAFGDLDILDSVTISGAGASSTIVTLGGGLLFDRLIDVFNSESTVTISGLTVTKGRADSGAGIRNSGSLGLRNVVVSENTAQITGGGIWNYGTLTLEDSIIERNGLTGSAIVGGAGGGIYNHGPLEATRLIIRGNSATAAKFGAAGGGIYNFGPATITDAVIQDNTASSGAGIENLGTLTLHRALVSGNQAREINLASPLGEGGGIVNYFTLVATNVTISGNHADRRAAGVLNRDHSTTLTNVTIADNTATGAGNSIINDGGEILLKNSIVYRIADDNCVGLMRSLGNNIDSGDSCGFNAQADQNNVEPRLESLADNGGFSRTHALQIGSPAIDTAADNACPPEDQRRLPRPRDGNGDGNGSCDIGAYEFQGANGGPVVTPTPTVPPISCTPRPQVRVEPAGPQTAPGTLTFRVTLSPPSGGGVNQFQWMSFDHGSNVTVEVPGQSPRPPGFIFTPGAVTTTTFTVRRINAGAFTVRLTVIDACGSWPTFVGGGPGVP